MAGRRAAGNLCNKAENQLKDGDVAGAKRTVDAALHSDPKFWPALYVRAKIFIRQGQYQLAIADCNEALRQYPGFVEASLLRASINAHLGKYAEALKEVNYLVSISPLRKLVRTSENGRCKICLNVSGCYDIYYE